MNRSACVLICGQPTLQLREFVIQSIPTVRDISLDLNGAKYFSKLDMSQAYHQLELTPSSRKSQHSQHMPVYIDSNDLIMELNAAAEIFQNTLQQLLHGIDGVRNIADDIIIFGSNHEEHNKTLETHGLTLNMSKCKFLKQYLKFFGMIFSTEGVRPDPKKISAFVNTATSSTVSEVRSLIGMANYSSQFIPNFATITEPLRRSTHKGVKFVWQPEHEEAYHKLKTAMINSPVMSYFDISKKTHVVVDASLVGLSAILAQTPPGKDTPPSITAYASRALTPTEQRYSQTEREALAIVWGIEHFHLYLYGAPFTLHTDHKALEIIFGNPLSKPPARIERWLLTLQQYDFNVVYTTGSENPADFLSRHPPPPHVTKNRNKT